MLPPSQIRTKVLALHEVVVSVLDELERMASGVRDGQLDAVRSKALELQVALATLIEEEEAYLHPTLRDLDAWGDVRAEQLELCHENNENALGRIRERAGRIAPDELAEELRQVVASIRRELEKERRQLLTADLLRDDLVIVAQSDG